MYLSFTTTSDLITVTRNVWCSFLLHKNYAKHQNQYLAKISVPSKYRVEPERIKSNDDGILNWLNVVQNLTTSF